MSWSGAQRAFLLNVFLKMETLTLLHKESLKYDTTLITKNQFHLETQLFAGLKNSELAEQP